MRVFEIIAEIAAAIMMFIMMAILTISVLALSGCTPKW